MANGDRVRVTECERHARYTRQEAELEAATRRVYGFHEDPPGNRLWRAWPCEGCNGHHVGRAKPWDRREGMERYGAPSTPKPAPSDGFTLRQALEEVDRERDERRRRHRTTPDPTTPLGGTNARGSDTLGGTPVRRP